MGNAQQDRSKCNIVKVEFMTKSQKEKKDIALKKLRDNQDIDDDFDIVQNEEEFYKVDFRQEIYIPTTIKEIDVGYVMKFFDNIDQQTNQNDDLQYPDLTEFVKTKVYKYFLLVNGIQIQDRTYKINMKQCLTSNPVFEFIYEKFTFLEGFAKKALYTITNLKRTLFRRIVKFLGLTPIIDAIMSIKKGSKGGILAALCSKRILTLVGSMVLGPNALMGGFSLILRTFFPFAGPLIYLMRLGTG